MLKPVDHETVKIDFLRKVNRRNPPFRQKVSTPGRPRMKVKLLQIETLIIVLTFFLNYQVPQIIKDQYKHPPLLPHRFTGSQPFNWSSIVPQSVKVIYTLHTSA